ncbi:MAG: DUF393 domain-containing protein [Bdellovibrionaceae bacterium]|nr:DUF393 domain-containing protein [Bdellovibrionales bacterium]MCB9084255.1 DUF393 domain-containing protein [Pseudobdellovibrionaceae bacterium]
MGNKEKILFFDGHCHLCNGLVDELIKRNKQGQLKFAPLQGQTAERLLSPEDRQDLKSLVFWVDGHIYRRSGGAIRAITSLGGFYRIFSILLVIPWFLRDPLYKVVAINRYNWFGRREQCRLPTTDEREYLLP